MKLRCIQMEIRPSYFSSPGQTIMEAVVTIEDQFGGLYHGTEILEEDHFESILDRLLRMTKDYAVRSMRGELKKDPALPPMGELKP